MWPNTRQCSGRPLERKTHFRQAKIRKKVPQTSRQEVSNATGTTAYSCSVLTACSSSQSPRLGITCSRLRTHNVRGIDRPQIRASASWRECESGADPLLEIREPDSPSPLHQGVSYLPVTWLTPLPVEPLYALLFSLLAPLKFFTRHLEREPRLTPVQSVSGELWR